MLDQRKNSCQIFIRKECPSQLMMEGSYPILQPLDPKQIQECQKLARSCNDTIIENRRHPRMPITLPARIVTATGVLEGETENVSLHGVFIRCQKPLMPGERLIVIAKLASNQSFNTHAEVVWSRAPRPNVDVVSHGMGVKLVD